MLNLSVELKRDYLGFYLQEITRLLVMKSTQNSFIWLTSLKDNAWIIDVAGYYKIVLYIIKVMNQQKQVGREISRKKKQPIKYKIQREYLLSNKNYSQINDFLKEYKELDLSTVRDEKGNSPLHQAAYNCLDIKILKRYLDYMENFCSQSFKDPSDRFKDFINSENNDGLTALHFAAYKGNFKAMELLCNQGADYTRQTKSGQNVLHLAAQGGMVQAFIYFQSLIDINCPDTKNSTPLHWAAYMNSESIITFLTAQPNIKINLQDEKLQTPLHLATAFGHTKIVKKLLRAGADRRILNQKGQIPLQIAQNNQFRNIQRILNDEYNCLDHLKLYLNLKNVFKPENRSYSMPILFTVSIALVIALRIFLLELTYAKYVAFIEYGFYALVYGVYFSLIKPPKRPRPQKYIDFLNGSVSMKKICLACANIKPLRSLHCDICKKCVERYDHHCYWINNCVGKNNIGRFVLFIFLFQVFLLYAIGLAVLVLSRYYGGQEYFIRAREDLEIFGVVYVYGIGLFSVGFSFPLMALIVVHIKNLLLNKTTYERYTKDKISTLSESTSNLLQQEMKSNKKTSYSIKNAIKMCRDRDEESQQSVINSSLAFEH